MCVYVYVYVYIYALEAQIGYKCIAPQNVRDSNVVPFFESKDPRLRAITTLVNDLS